MIHTNEPLNSASSRRKIPKKDHLFLVPKDKPKKLIPLSTQFYQIQQQAQQQALEENSPVHTAIQPDNIELQHDSFLQLYPTTPTSETSLFQQVPIFEHNSIDNITTNDSVTDQTDEPLEVHDDKSLQLVPASVSNTLTYHQFPGAKQLQFIISLSPQISQLLDANIPQQISILCNTTNL